MAISKERLEELLEQEATVWFVSNKNVTPFWLLKDNNYVFESLEKMDLYENKEDAEFIAKYHTSIVEKFEPPIYEDIKDGKPYRFNFTSNGKHYNFFASVLLIELLYVCEEEVCNEQVICQHSTKENYYKAVEQARKLFLGEEDA